MALDFSNIDLPPEDEAIDFDTLDAGGLPEAGVYHARLEKEEFVDDGDYPRQQLVFIILAGTVSGQKGRRLTDSLFLMGKDDAKTKKAIQRAMAFGKRMNIYSKEDAEKRAPIPFEKCVGKEFIIEVVADEYEGNDGNLRRSAKLSYMGIWHINHPDAPECPRLGKSGKPGAGGSAGKVEPVKPQPGKPGAKANGTPKKAAELTEI